MAGKSCDLQVAIFKDKNYEGKVRFQLMGTPEKDKEKFKEGTYIAVGISDDDRMVQDRIVTDIVNS